MQTARKLGAATVSLCVLSLLSLQLSAAAGVPVEGDVQLLRMVRDAQITNAAQFQRGAMRCKIHDRRVDLQIDATVVWDGEKTFWEYELSERMPRTEGTNQPKGRRTEKGRFIEEGKLRSFYFPESRFAQIINNGNQGYRDQFKVRPKDLWFKMEGIHVWAEFLNPDAEPPPIFSLTVRRDGDDRVIMERRNQRNDVMTVVASLAQDGNIIQYESAPHSGNESLPKDSRSFWRWGRYQWAKDARGVWYLKHYEYKRSSTGSPTELNFDFVVDVESFNPNPDIPPDRFKLASLKLPNGTTVEEIGPNPKTYRIGGKQDAVKQDTLDSLSDLLRSKAFIRPKR